MLYVTNAECCTVPNPRLMCKKCKAACGAGDDEDDATVNDDDLDDVPTPAPTLNERTSPMRDLGPYYRFVGNAQVDEEETLPPPQLVFNNPLAGDSQDDLTRENLRRLGLATGRDDVSRMSDDDNEVTDADIAKKRRMRQAGRGSLGGPTGNRSAPLVPPSLTANLQRDWRTRRGG